MQIKHSATTTAAQWLGKIEPGFRQFGFTYGQWSVGDLIKLCMDQMREPCQIDLITWRLNSKYTDEFVEMAATGRIKRLRLAVDRMMPRFADNKERCRRISALIGDENVRVLRTHAKAAAIYSANWHIALHGSANLNANPRVEQVSIEDNPDCCNAIIGVIDNIFATQPPGWGLDRKQLKLDGIIDDDNGAPKRVVKRKPQSVVARATVARLKRSILKP